MKLLKVLLPYILGTALLWFCLKTLLDSGEMVGETVYFFKFAIPLRELLKELAEMTQTLLLVSLAAPIALELLSAIGEKMAELSAPAATAIANEIKSTVVTGFKDVADSIKASIEKDGVNLFPVGPISIDKELNEKLKQSLFNYEKKLSIELSQIINQANDDIAQGRYLQGLNTLKDLTASQANPAIFKILLSAYATVLDRGETEKIPRYKLLQEATVLLKPHGDPIHYQTIAYKYWENGGLANAIDVAEKGLKKFEHSKEDQLAVMGLRNSLAYYYADSGDLSKKEISLQLINEALSYWQHELSQREGAGADIERRYANSLDTLGFIKITFGETVEELREGEMLCKKALDMGLESDLYIKHFSKYSEKMKTALSPNNPMVSQNK